jgi:hypothetical protein
MVIKTTNNYLILHSFIFKGYALKKVKDFLLFKL